MEYDRQKIICGGKICKKRRIKTAANYLTLELTGRGDKKPAIQVF